MKIEKLLKNKKYLIILYTLIFFNFVCFAKNFDQYKNTMNYISSKYLIQKMFLLHYIGFHHLKQEKLELLFVDIGKINQKIKLLNMSFTPLEKSS